MPKTKTNPRRVPCTRADVERAKMAAVDLATKRMLVITVYFLKDKLGLRDEEFTRACMLLNRTFDEVADGTTTLAEIQEVLRDDYWLNFKMEEVM